MNKNYRTYIFFNILFFFFIFTIQSLNAQVSYHQHKVKKGETLYRLSVNYGITVQQILENNPGLSSATLKENMLINIPNMNYSNGNQDSLLVESYKQHKIKKKETLWSIAKQYGITVEDLKKANSHLSPEYKLKKGKYLNIPVITHIKSTSQPVQEVDALEKIKVGIVLPFTAQGTGADRCIEFYRGFLMAADILKDNNKEIIIYAFNEPTAQQSIAQVLDSLKSINLDLLIGPLYFEHFTDFAVFASTEKTKTLIPFSSKLPEVKTNPYLYLLNAPEELKNNLVVEKFSKQFKDYRVVFLLDNNGDKLIQMHHLRNQIIKKGFDVMDLNSDCSDEKIKEICHPSKSTLFVTAGATKNYVSSMISKFKRLKDTYPQLTFSILGYHEWINYEDTFRNDYHYINTYIYAPNYYMPWQNDTRKIANNYKQWFNEEFLVCVPRMAPLGYDCAMYMLGGMFKYGEKFPNQTYQSTFLQSSIDLHQTHPNGGFTNCGMMLVHYQKNGKIELYK